MEKEVKGKVITELEDLKELIEREKASVLLLLSVASGADRLEEDIVVMTMRDCHDRIEKMEASLERIGELVILGELITPEDEHELPPRLS